MSLHEPTSCPLDRVAAIPEPGELAPATLLPPPAPPEDRRVLVAMSGGVDSSVTAALLVEAGYDVVGVTLRLYDDAEARKQRGDARPSRGCCAPEDLEDARRVGDRLGIPVYVSNHRERFRDEVIRYFVDEYRAGRTPNPCVMCNEQVKYGWLLERREGLAAGLLATGHYARVDRVEDAVGPRYRLLRGVDPAKDQSYFLFTASQARLSQLWFPIGALSKPQVRAVAARIGLSVAAKRDSQEICFAPHGDYARVVNEELERREGAAGVPAPGEIVHLDGRVLGRHGGVHRFTVGQRRGIGIASTDPLYVVRLDAETRQVVVGPAGALESTGLRAQRASWVSGRAPEDGQRVQVRLRHKSAPQPARFVAQDGAGAFALRFDAPLRAVSPGQAAVLYDGDEVLGGGFIERHLGEGAA